MLTVLIEAADDAAALGATLATLVPGAVEGVVREVAVVDGGLDGAARKVADHAGCQVVAPDAFAGAIARARGDWLLLLEPGARLGADWIEAVIEHVAAVEAATRTPRAARFSPAPQSRPGLFRRLTHRPTALAEGLLLPKDQAIGLSRARLSLEAMGRGVAATRLAATIRPRAPAPGRR